MVVGIVGGGASGMSAAITAAQELDNQIILFERQARVGKKLAATGNGRCNLSNIHACERGYHGMDVSFSQSALSCYPPDETLSWFGSLGLFTVTEDSGKVYPYSDQANSVVDVLRFALDKPNIQLRTGFEVTKIKKHQDGFLIKNSEESVYCDKLIVAAGGLAGTKLGGTMAGYNLLRSLGHQVTKLRPSLVQLKSRWHGVSGLKGVRAACTARIIHDGKQIACSTGELQFTEYGLSGPVIFEISRDACQEKGEWSCVLDFLPNHSEEQLYTELSKRRSTALSADELLTGILHNRLGRVLVQTAGIAFSTPISQLSDEALRGVCGMVKGLDVAITEPLGMDSAQVTAGGICTDEFDPQTLESRLVPGLFACGEVLDVDGDCGGYNLQWAWSSGRLAGYNAGRN
ncbi:MAG: NAD(P)/FAD-dependent oxidoreductase [Oscillospiraceae bacterium]|nr:NAD(P)/FAD-dependent oxidoreductase [Oscillospiraceae bacterium]